MSGHDATIHSSEAVIDNGKFGKRIIRFETGRIARQAAGSAVVTLDEDTMLLSATTASKNPKDQFDFFPLTVDVEERMYAVGRIPGSFFRREGRPSEDAILTCRLIDRPLRPSFVKGLRNEVQIVVTVLSLNPAHLYDVVAINASSMSTQLAGLPFSGPIGGVRIALIDGQWVAFPTHSELERSQLLWIEHQQPHPAGEGKPATLGIAQGRRHLAFQDGGAHGPEQPHAGGPVQPRRVHQHQHIRGGVGPLVAHPFDQGTVLALQQPHLDARAFGEALVEILVGVVVATGVHAQGGGPLAAGQGACQPDGQPQRNRAGAEVTPAWAMAAEPQRLGGAGHGGTGGAPPCSQRRSGSVAEAL